MDRPTLSVIIPTYNRLDALQQVLRGYEQQRGDDLDFEVVVVDDGSADETPDFLAAYRSRRFPLRFDRQTNSGPARARNRGLELASGRWVLFTGDDIEPHSDLLSEHLRAHRRLADPDVAVLGLTRWPADVPLTATMRHIDGPGAQQFSYHYFEDGAEYDFRHFYTSNISVRRDLLDLEPEYFSTDFPAAAFEDAELAYRLARHGLRIVYVASAVGFHHHHYDPGAFFRRQQRCGEMAAVLYEKFPELGKWFPLGELEALRPPPGGDPAKKNGEGLMEWERRAITLATFFDDVPIDLSAVLLRPLFHHAYRRGLAQALYDERRAEAVAEASFLELIPAAALALEQDARRLGLPCPQADTRALGALAPPRQRS